MMKILLLTYDFAQSASGKVTETIADELFIQGNTLLVLTRTSKQCNKSYKIVRCKEICSNNIFRRYFYHLLWKIYSKTSEFDYRWQLKTIIYGIILCIKFKPDIIYARSTPFSPCIVASFLGKIMSLPVCCHFSDPLPAPVEYLSNFKARRYYDKVAKLIIKASDLISFNTQEAIEYEECEIGIQLKSKSFVSGDPCPKSGMQYFSQHFNQGKFYLTYLGNIYGSRNPYPLFEAISMLRREGVDISLHIYSNKSFDTIYDFVFFEGVTDDISIVKEKSNVLIDIDGDDRCSVFVSSKLKDYLITNRPVLSITPIGSPSYNLLSGLTTIYITTNDVNSIYISLKQLLPRNFVASDYCDRQCLIEFFDKKNIVASLLIQLKNLLQQ